MSERLQYWVATIGSAAMVAFVATCLDAPRVATFACDTPPGASREQCRLLETLPVAAETTQVSSAGSDASSETAAVASRAVN